MSEQQQPKEYIITEPQLAAIEIVLNQAGIPMKRNVLLTEIRSRPHPAPARDFVDTPEKPWCYPGCMLVCNAKAEAARKAREDVLEDAVEIINEVEQFIKKEAKLTMLQWNDVEEHFKKKRALLQAGDHHE